MEYPVVSDILGPSAWTNAEKVGFFENALRSTDRDGIEKVIEMLRSVDFYYAPSSTKFHSNYQGGLLDHSLLVLSTAMKLRNSMIELKPDLAPQLEENSVIISALLHDLCKACFYVPTEKWKKNKNDQWESYTGYEVKDVFPIGHGEKSVILLQCYGLHLTLEEMLAIRYHMGLWTSSIDCGDSGRSYFRAVDMCPLVTIIQNADFMSSYMLENRIEH